MVLMKYTKRCIFVAMDKLKTYLMALPVAERMAFAQQCGTTWPFLRNIAYGYRLAGEKLCVAIEKATAGQVARRDLRPDDWHEIWPELAEREAPSA